MPRVWLCPVSLLWCLLVVEFFYVASIAGDCWYNGNIYEEDVEVKTKEPCLNCTCTRGTLICYLRVCPRLPNPPPPGCILLHKFQTCCPELICTDFPFSNKRIESRAEPDSDLTAYDPSNLKNVCVANGTIYGPGSAMDSSSLCEYCYCLGGRQRCVKPKCLLPIDGCTPLYDPNDCCPVHYNCTGPQFKKKTTTTLAPLKLTKEGKCFAAGRYYAEGGKVIGVGHSICDNCYCIRGLVRCEPISCAPPLLGCVPVIRAGECCASSYNCSGAIETEPEPNYGNYTILSKDYAKLRKQVVEPPQKHQRQQQQQLSNTKNEEDNNAPYYVIAESLHGNTKTAVRGPITFGTTRQFTGTTTTLDPTLKSLFYKNIDSKFRTNDSNRSTTRTNPEPLLRHADNRQHNRKEEIDDELLMASTNYKYNNDVNQKLTMESSSTAANEPRNAEPVRLPERLSYYNALPESGDPLQPLSSFFDERNNRRIDSDNKTDTTTKEESSPSTDATTMIADTTTLGYETTALSEETTSYEESTTITTDAPAADDVPLINVTNSTNCVGKNLTLASPTPIPSSNFSAGNSATRESAGESELELNASVGESSKMDSRKDELANNNSGDRSPANGGVNRTRIVEEDGDKLNGTNSPSIDAGNGPTDNGTLSETITAGNDDAISNETDADDDEGTSEEDDATLTTSGSSVEATTLNDITIVDLESKVKVATATAATSNNVSKLKIPIEIEAILDRTKHKENDYDDGDDDDDGVDDEYDYNESSLPPSLPNLKIIPFVAADAVKSKPENAQENAIYPSITNVPTSTIYANLFSPPVETEGGFVPRDPPLLDGFYDVDSSVTVVSAPDVTNMPTEKNNCLVDNREVRHGEEVPSEVTCMICVCLYGNVVCHDVQCPVPRPGCKKVPKPPSATALECCPQIVCETPTVVLDRSDEDVNEKDVLGVPELITPDPFKDVIKTEPAPDLQSIIGDILRRQMTTVKYASTDQPTTTLPSIAALTDNSLKNATQPYNTLDQMLHFLIGEIDGNGENNANGITTNPTPNASSSPSPSETRENFNNINSILDNNHNAGSVGAILKLAGCNIYGRMYRVGRIIFELSGPCKECKCTETGVQCNTLKC